MTTAMGTKGLMSTIPSVPVTSSINQSSSQSVNQRATKTGKEKKSSKRRYYGFNQKGKKKRTNKLVQTATDSNKRKNKKRYKRRDTRAVWGDGTRERERTVVTFVVSSVVSYDSTNNNDNQLFGPAMTAIQTGSTAGTYLHNCLFVFVQTTQQSGKGNDKQKKVKRERSRIYSWCGRSSTSRYKRGRTN